MFRRAVEHRRDRIVLRHTLPSVRIDAAAVHADADRAVVVAGDLDQIPHLLLPRLGSLVVIKMARVVADLVDVRRDDFGQPVVLLQIDRQVAFGLLANLGERLGVLAGCRRRCARHRPRRCMQRVDLRDGGVNVLRLRGRHALHGDRRSPPINRADANGAGRIADDIEFCFGSHAGIVLLTDGL